MRDALALVRTYVATPRSDVLLAAVLALGTVPFVLGEIGLSSRTWVAPLTAVTMCCSVGVRRRFPLADAVAIAAVSTLARVCGQLTVVNNGSVGAVISSLAIGAVFLVSYSVGEREEVWPALLGAALLLVAVNIVGQVFNPFASVVALGPWFAGRVVASRRHLNDQLQIRSQELDAERELFAREAVRYERTRIARELHDIVAHCVSVMVIQANAGQRLLAEDPSRAVAALDSISEAARQAEEEVARLVDLLGVEAGTSDVSGLHLVERLVAQAAATGIEIDCRFEGNGEGLVPATSDAAFRVVQEGITNALKHAPGSRLEVLIKDAADHVAVGVVNGPALGERSGLEGAGGGHGLSGMRERVLACGGDFDAGPLRDGGWRISVTLPKTIA